MLPDAAAAKRIAGASQKEPSLGSARAAALAGVLAAATALFFLPSPAAAYIDPGTGSALLYVVGAVITSIYFAARSLYYRLLDLVFRVRLRDSRCSVAVTARIRATRSLSSRC